MSMLSPRSVLLAALSPFLLTSANLPVVLSRTGPVKTESIQLTNLDTKHQYSLLYSIKTLRSVPEVRVEIVQGTNTISTKTLHHGDPDWYTQFRVPSAGAATLRVTAPASSVNYSLQV